MQDELSSRYGELLTGSYDCVDRIVLNAYFRMGHSPGGFRHWWRLLNGSDENLDNTHLMRMAGRFSRRLRAYAKAKGIPVIDCIAGERKHEIAEECLSKNSETRGLLLILVARAKAPIWKVEPGKARHLSRKKGYVNHYSFHIMDPEWGHITIKICGHPPFMAQVLLNGHEYVACQAGKAGIDFTKEGNCFTHISDAAGLARVADTLSEQRTIGRLSRVCERWIYHTCLWFALSTQERARSGFCYQYSIYQLESSRNLLFEVGGKMEQVFQALIERTRAPLGLDKIKTIFGAKRRPRYRKRKNRTTQWGSVVEKPTYDLTVFKVHCRGLTMKIYTKGERALRIEVIAHNAKKLPCGCSLEKFPKIVTHLKGILERFMNALSCMDVCFVSDDTLEQLPLPSQVGKSRVGGIDFNKARIRRVANAVSALSASPGGFTASELATKVCTMNGLEESQYGPRRAAYDLKKLRGKQLVRKLEGTRRYEPFPQGLRAITALAVLRDKVIQPLLAAACQAQPATKPNKMTALDKHYKNIQTAMRDLFAELGVAA
jgi:hypothetical protein